MAFDYYDIEDPPVGRGIGVEQPWSGSPAADIDYENRMSVPQRVYATAQDNAYLAEQRAERAAADPRYANEQRKMQIQAEEDAVHFAGQKQFEQLVAAGMPPEKALRETGHLIFWNHFDKMASAYSHMPDAAKIPTQLSGTPIVDPNTGAHLGWSVIDPRTGGVHSTEFPKPAQIPPDAAAKQKMTAGEIGMLERDLNRQRKALEADPNNTDLARAALATQQRLEGLRQQYVVGSTNWMGQARSMPPRVDFMNPATQSPAAPTGNANEVIRFTRDGKRAIFDAATKKFLRFAE